MQSREAAGVRGLSTARSTAAAAAVGSLKRARPIGAPMPRRPASLANSTSHAHKDDSRAAKRSKGPCDDEVACRALVQQREQLIRLVKERADGLVALEKSMLEFYYTHAACYHEDKLVETVQQDVQGVTGDAATTTAPCRTSGTPLFSPQTAYYAASELSQLQCTVQATAAAHAAELRAATERLAQLEATVQREVIDGSLAAQRAVNAQEEASYAAVQDELHQQESSSRALSDSIATENEKAVQLRAQQKECSARQAVLAEKKKAQMENIDNTRMELLQVREEAKAARQELKRREAVVRELQREIDRRRDRLRHRRGKS